MKQIDFEHGKITDNILRASIPMLVAEVLSLLYNIVDRIYIARIPDVGTTALGAVGLCFPIITIILAFSNLFGSGGAPLFSIERLSCSSKTFFSRAPYSKICAGVTKTLPRMSVLRPAKWHAPMTLSSPSLTSTTPT